MAVASVLIFLKRRLDKKAYEYKDIITIVVVAISIIFAIALLGMIMQQIYLISFGKTTNEFIRNKYDDKIFDEGCSNNWKRTFLCGKKQEAEEEKEKEKEDLDPHINV